MTKAALLHRTLKAQMQALAQARAQAQVPALSALSPKALNQMDQSVIIKAKRKTPELRSRDNGWHQ